MKKQLQYTTAFVILLLAVLMGSLYMINTSPAFDGQTNLLTAATTAGASMGDTINTPKETPLEIDCTTPPTEASQEEQLAWEKACKT
jgi:hypothetical protein